MNVIDRIRQLKASVKNKPVTTGAKVHFKSHGSTMLLRGDGALIREQRTDDTKHVGKQRRARNKHVNKHGRTRREMQIANS